MLKPKLYLRVLFVLIFFIGILTAGYVYDFSKKYPPPITSRISLDAKLKFIREHIDPTKIDTIVVGSSLGLNNVLGPVLEKYSKNIHHVLNLSIFSVTTLQAEQLLELSDAFPNLKRIIYSAQYSDFPHARKFKVFDLEILKKYMLNKLSPLELSKLLANACSDIQLCKKRAEIWEDEYMQKDSFGNLDFDYTGSSPLAIYKQEKVGGRWHLPHPGIMHNESFLAVTRMASKAEQRGVAFYMVHQPYRPELILKHPKVKDALEYFDKRITQALQGTKGMLIRLDKLPLKNTSFADRSHLNEKGATLVTKEIAKMIDRNERNRRR